MVTGVGGQQSTCPGGSWEHSDTDSIGVPASGWPRGQEEEAEAEKDKLACGPVSLTPEELRAALRPPQSHQAHSRCGWHLLLGKKVSRWTSAPTSTRGLPTLIPEHLSKARALALVCLLPEPGGGGARQATKAHSLPPPCHRPLPLPGVRPFPLLGSHSSSGLMVLLAAVAFSSVGL